MKIIWIVTACNSCQCISELIQFCLVGFVSLKEYQPLMGYLMLKFYANNLHIVICFQVFQSNTYPFQIYVSDPELAL